MYEPTFKSTRFVRCPSYDRKLYAPLRLSGSSPTAPMGTTFVYTRHKFGREIPFCVDRFVSSVIRF